MLNLIPLDTITINRFFAKVSNCKYIGCFAADCIPNPKLLTAPYGFVANTATSSSSGLHWISIFVPEKNLAYYYDSLGQPPSKHFLNFLSSFKKYIFNENIYQHPFSTVCGYHAIGFLLMCFKGHNYHIINKLLSKIQKNADIFMVHLVSKFLKNI